MFEEDFEGTYVYCCLLVAETLSSGLAGRALNRSVPVRVGRPSKSQSRRSRGGGFSFRVYDRNQ